MCSISVVPRRQLYFLHSPTIPQYPTPQTPSPVSSLLIFRGKWDKEAVRWTSLEFETSTDGEQIFFAYFFHQQTYKDTHREPMG